jgi:hypothetical protein
MHEVVRRERMGFAIQYSWADSCERGAVLECRPLRKNSLNKYENLINLKAVSEIK